jgi:ParB family chromosome partitioning protein
LNEEKKKEECGITYYVSLSRRARRQGQARDAPAALRAVYRSLSAARAVIWGLRAIPPRESEITEFIMSTESKAQFKFIEARHLSLSPINVRKTGGDAGIEQLADLIAAEGILQNLDVYESEGGEGKKKTTHAVVAGGRRWRALQLLIRQKRIKPDFVVPCLVINYDRAVQISLAENSGREPMHPADEFDAFKQLIDAGQSIEDVAARFGVTPLVVQRRLKLASVAPQFIDLYRKGKVTLEHLMAFAVTDDHERQQKVWESLKSYDRHPASIRRALTEHEVSARSPLAKFVGVKAYEKAGGAVRRDLFQADDEGVMLDAELVRKLAQQKLDTQAEKLRAEGLAWVEVRPDWDYSERAQFGRVRTVLRPATEGEQAKIDALNAQRAELDARLEAADEDEEQYDALSEQMETLESKLQKIDDAREAEDPAQQACAGAVVAIGHDGKVHIERDLLKPEDAKRFARKSKEASAAPKAPREHSAALARRLNAQRTLALQAVLAERPDVAVVALTHRLVLRTFAQYVLSRDSVLKIEAHNAALGTHAEELAVTKAHAALQARREALEAKLPDSAEQLFAWLLGQPQADVLALLAFCIAQSADGVSDDERNGAVDELARAAGLDMREWWSATAANYFESIPKSRVLDIVRETVSPEAAATLTKLKKDALTKAAEQKVAGTGWLPALLRNVA